MAVAMVAMGEKAEAEAAGGAGEAAAMAVTQEERRAPEQGKRAACRTSCPSCSGR